MCLTWKALFAFVVLRFVSPNVQHTDSCKHSLLAKRIAPIVMKESERFGINPFVVLAAIKRESGFQITARGKAGEIGLMQIKRGGATAGFETLTDTQLEQPDINIYLGVRYMYWSRRRCGGEPWYWLGAYNGLHCGPSRYATKVLTTLSDLMGSIPQQEDRKNVSFLTSMAPVSLPSTP
jgi:soluble lytic murein transglycosylase-like protein